MKMNESIKRLLQKDIAWLFNNLTIPESWDWDVVYNKPKDYPDFQIQEIKIINPAEGEVIFDHTTVGVAVHSKYASGRYEQYTFSDTRDIEFRKVFRRAIKEEVKKITVEESFRFPGTSIIIEKGDVIEVPVEIQEVEKKCECGQPLMGDATECTECMGKNENVDLEEAAEREVKALNAFDKVLLAAISFTVKDKNLSKWQMALKKVRGAVVKDRDKLIKK